MNCAQHFKIVEKQKLCEVEKSRFHLASDTQVAVDSTFPQREHFPEMRQQTPRVAKPASEHTGAVKRESQGEKHRLRSEKMIRRKLLSKQNRSSLVTTSQTKSAMREHHRSRLKQSGNLFGRRYLAAADYRYHCRLNHRKPEFLGVNGGCVRDENENRPTR